MTDHDDGRAESVASEQGRNSAKSAPDGAGLKTSIQFLVVLGAVLVALFYKVPDLAAGLLHGEAVSYFAVALVTAFVAVGLWWLKRRDRRRSGHPDLLAAAGGGKSFPESPRAESGAPDQATVFGPGPRSHKAVVEFELFLRTITPRVWLVPAIIAVNVAVYVAMVARGVAPFSPSVASVLAWGANYGPRTLGGQPWRLLTCMFLHYGAFHLLMNMAVLWDVGRLLERIYGQARFAAIYLAAGVSAGFASLLIHPQAVGAGASGAVFGVYGALGAFLLRERGALPGPVLSQLSRFAIGFVAYNMLFSMTDSTIDAAAHVGGLLGGAAAGAWLARPLVSARRLAPTSPATIGAIALCLVAAAPVLLAKPADFTGTLARFASDSAAILNTYEGLMAKAARENLQEPEVARQLQEAVVIPWSEARARISAPERWSPKERKVVASLIEYASVQEQSFSSLVTALRGHDEKALSQSRAYGAEANRLVEELNKTPH
jgi:rhomboid protease GluP